MLVLSRKIGETIVLPELGVTIRLLWVGKARVHIGIDAEGKQKILRGEVLHRLKRSAEPVAGCP